MVLLDDLQWIDEGSAALLHFVARSFGDPARLLLADIELEGLEAGFFHVFTGQAMIAFKAPGGYWRLVVALPDTAPEKRPVWV